MSEVFELHMILEVKNNLSPNIRIKWWETEILQTSNSTNTILGISSSQNTSNDRIYGKYTKHVG